MMKTVIFALLLTLGSFSSAAVKVTDKPITDESSCDTKVSPAKYYVWIPSSSSGLAEPLVFNLKLEKPSNAVAVCTVCKDGDTSAYCKYITCTIDTKQYPIKATDVVLPSTAPSPSADITTIDGWDIVKNNAKVATNATCFSNYLKIGALLFVSLFLF